MLCAVLVPLSAAAGLVAAVTLRPDIRPVSGLTASSHGASQPESSLGAPAGSESASASSAAEGQASSPTSESSAPEQEGQAPSQGSEPSAGGEGDNRQAVKAIMPDEMKAIWLKAGVDYLRGGESPEELRAQIDDAIDSAAELTMNTIVFEAQTSNAVLYASSLLPGTGTDLDIASYIVEKARQKGLYVYAVYNALSLSQEGGLVQASHINAEVINQIVKNASEFASLCQPDGVLIDQYYCPSTENSYARYLATGSAMGFEVYATSSVDKAFIAVAETLRLASPGLQVGLMTEAVWENQAADPSGSVTSASFCALSDGNADNRRYVKNGWVDFVAVKAYGSLKDGSEPFRSVVSWWADLASVSGMPLYVVHAADKACTEAVGWSEYDELSRQVIESRKLSGYKGSIFNSLSRLQEDPKSCTTMLIKYYKNEVKAEHILTELAVTKPAKTTYTTFEPSVNFVGASDPNTEVTINGEPISTDQNGYFSVNMDMEPGLNKYVIVHKGKTVTYNITRQVQVVKEDAPTGDVSVDGGMKITISAVAYQSAKVYAVLNGQKVPMEMLDSSEEESLRDTYYKRYQGVYTAPAATTADQDLGNIVVYGSWGGFGDNLTGAHVTVNKKASLADGKPVVVIADSAETFSIDVLDNNSDPSYYPLPKGAMDYTASEELVYRDGDTVKSFYILQSGLRVYADDIMALSASSGPDNNRITGYTVTSDSEYTYVTFNTQQTVSYTARYSSAGFSMEFHYTASVPGSMKLNRNPLFSNASWSGTKLTLALQNSGHFFGYCAYYDNSDNLVLRFNNPPPAYGNDLSGVRIVVDPGHGGSDPGAIGFLNAYPEKVINDAIATRLTDILRSRGADVVMLDTLYDGMSLEDRVASAKAQNPHLFISVHANWGYSSSARGSEAYYFYDFSSKLAAYSSYYTANALNTINRGGKFGRYYVIRDPQFPSTMIETGFVTNEGEYWNLLDENCQQDIAYGLADAVCEYFKAMGCDGGGAVTGTQSVGS
jgi:N-acetylmuramoyl-L-alanine amidase/uncharacterized lipoprotein YddW (UPF0748 family)